MSKELESARELVKMLEQKEKESKIKLLLFLMKPLCSQELQIMQTKK